MNGTFTFQYRVLDEPGGTQSAATTVTLVITPVDSGPYVAVDDAFTIDEDVVLTVDDTTVPPGSMGMGGLFANDTTAPPDYTEVASVRVVTPPAHGTLTGPNVNGSFTYTPALNYNGVDTFTYVVNDRYTDSNEATVTITINSINDPPQAVNDTYTVAEDTALTIHFSDPLLPLLPRRSQWTYFEDIGNTNDPDGVDGYPVDGESDAWYSLAFDTAATNYGDVEDRQRRVRRRRPDRRPGFDHAGRPQRRDRPRARTAEQRGCSAARSRSIRRRWPTLTALNVGLISDDGGVLYINGVEVLRYNLPTAPDGDYHRNLRPRPAAKRRITRNTSLRGPRWRRRT